MPIINSYPQDINIQDQDAWVGTDYNTRNTKQYTAQAVANYLNQKGKVSIAGQIAYKFVDTPFSGQGTMALSPNNGTSFSAITGFKIAKANLTGKPVVAYLQFLVGQEILIVNQNDPESFGHYTINTYAVDANNDQYYDIALSFLGGNGSISIDNFYDIINFTFGDKTFIYDQVTPATIWGPPATGMVYHGLNKFPSITVVDSAKSVVVGDYTYVDNNNVILEFSAAFAGKAYFN